MKVFILSVLSLLLINGSVLAQDNGKKGGDALWRYRTTGKPTYRCRQKN